MTDNLESLVIEHLRHIRRRVDQTAEDVRDLKLRMSSLESAMLTVKREVSHGDETDARQQVSIDRLAERIERIERRLDLLPRDRGKIADVERFRRHQDRAANAFRLRHRRDAASALRDLQGNTRYLPVID